MKIKKYSLSDLKKELRKDKKFRYLQDNLSLKTQLIRIIYEIRLNKGLTQKEFSKLIGVKQSSLARFENANTNPSTTFVQKIADKLGMCFEVTCRKKIYKSK